MEMNALMAVMLSTLILEQVAISLRLSGENGLDLTLFPKHSAPSEDHLQLQGADDTIYREEPPLLLSLIGNSTKLEVLLTREAPEHHVCKCANPTASATMSQGNHSLPPRQTHPSTRLSAAAHAAPVRAVPGILADLQPGVGCLAVTGTWRRALRIQVTQNDAPGSPPHRQGIFLCYPSPDYNMSVFPTG